MGRADAVRVLVMRDFDDLRAGDVMNLPLTLVKVLASAGVVQILTGKKNGR